MTRDVNRRDFLGAASLTALALGLPTRTAFADDAMFRRFANLAPRLKARPFDLHDVRLRPGIQLTGLETNRKFMMALEPDRLERCFLGVVGLRRADDRLLRDRRAGRDAAR